MPKRMACVRTCIGLLLLTAISMRVASASSVCAPCHRSIYESYSATPMARSAHPVEPPPGIEKFDHNSFDASGFHYRVSPTTAGMVLTFEKPESELRGEVPLAYAIGSGERAISYLISSGGFLYEAPVAFYASTHSWALAPGYAQYSYPYLLRPIVPGCLSCHASGVQPARDTLNRYGSPPFLDDGVSCERCHGDGAAHVAAHTGKPRSEPRSGSPADDAKIVNPAKLAPPNRDSICSQCHLTGDARVFRPNADWRTFRPGDRLSDSQTVFVRAGKNAGMTVTGHVENLALSACKRNSGDRLWCGSCHDPHVVPAPDQASAYYRSRCLTCHTEKPCTETAKARAAAKDNCVQCHMPKSSASDAQHVVLTDHSIPRRPGSRSTGYGESTAAELIPFDGGKPSARDFALAYGIAAIGKTSGPDRDRALTLLEASARQNPNDSETLLYLAEIYRTGGQGELAIPLYRRAIELDRAQATGPAGLGGTLMERGDLAGAIPFFRDALSKNAGLQLVRMDLAVALWQTGDRAGARTILREGIALNPGYAPARDLLRRLSQAP